MDDGRTYGWIGALNNAADGVPCTAVVLLLLLLPLLL